MRFLSLVIGIPTIWAACNQCPFPSLNVTAFLPCLKPVIGEDCCATGRPLVKNPCIRVWLHDPQLAPYASIVDKARVACSVDQLAPCDPAVANACPAECAMPGGSNSATTTTTTTTVSHSGAGGSQSQTQTNQNSNMQSQNMQGQNSQGQSMQGQNMQGQNMQGQACNQCPLPNFNQTALQACMGPNITQACCIARRPLVSDPCAKIWLAHPMMAPFSTQLANAAQVCNTTQDQISPCNVSIAQACPDQCALAPNCSQACPLPTLNLSNFAPCMNATIGQSCCAAGRPLISNPCAKVWLANPVLAHIANQLEKIGAACKITQVASCNASLAKACPSACAAPLGLFSNHSSSNFTYNNNGGAWQAQNGAQTPCQQQAAAQQAACAGRMGCPAAVTCNPDGSFAPLQCRGSTGECWCVDNMGNEIPNTRNNAGATTQSSCAMLMNSTTTTVNSTTTTTTTTTKTTGKVVKAGKVAKAGKRFRKGKKAKAKAQNGNP